LDKFGIVKSEHILPVLYRLFRDVYPGNLGISIIPEVPEIQAAVAPEIEEGVILPNVPVCLGNENRDPIMILYVLIKPMDIPGVLLFSVTSHPFLSWREGEQNPRKKGVDDLFQVLLLGKKGIHDIFRVSPVWLLLYCTFHIHRLFSRGQGCFPPAVGGDKAAEQYHPSLPRTLFYTITFHS
jgi:hypothetical protein